MTSDVIIIDIICYVMSFYLNTRSLHDFMTFYLKIMILHFISKKCHVISMTPL